MLAEICELSSVFILTLLACRLRLREARRPADFYTLQLRYANVI